MRLALFDFDGTLTRKDSLSEFIIFCVGKKKYYFKLFFFTPVYLLYKTKLLDNSLAKELLFRLFFSGITQSQFTKLSKEFSLSFLDKLLREDIYLKFQKHIADGDRVIIVSASMRCWLEPWSNKEKVELLCTELEFKDGIFSGHFKTKNCHGEEKLRRVQEHLSLRDYETIFAYGDSSGDDALLAIADYPYRV